MRNVLICQILIVGVSLMFTTSCKKDTNNSNTNDLTLIDIDGNVYDTVRIGTQTWMVQNLRTTHYNDGTAIPNITDATAWSTLSTPGYCWYKNDETSNKPIYGALYNWHVINTGKLCPKGWHVPTNDEFTVLENYLIANGYNYDGKTSGNNYAKALASITGWSLSTNPGAIGTNDYPSKRNATGFTARPGGYRTLDGTFALIGDAGYWWSSSENGPSLVWYRQMYFNISNISSTYINKGVGFSIRCIKN